MLGLDGNGLDISPLHFLHCLDPCTRRHARSDGQSRLRLGLHWDQQSGACLASWGRKSQSRIQDTGPRPQQKNPLPLLGLEYTDQRGIEASGADNDIDFSCLSIHSLDSFWGKPLDLSPNEVDVVFDKCLEIPRSRCETTVTLAARLVPWLFKSLASSPASFSWSHG